MAHYTVSYTIGENNTYIYPESVKGIIWKSIVYHATQKIMVCETDAAVKADGKDIVLLTQDKANQLKKEYQDSHPKGNLPDQTG